MDFSIIYMPDLIIEKKLLEQGFQNIAAVDEAGRGPLAGPVVAACIIISQKNNLNHPLWHKVRDSKQLSATKREELYSLIFDEIKTIGVGIVDNVVIDRINILQATFLAMKKALGNVKSRIDIALIDGKFKIPNFSTKQEAFIKGDQRLASISAASIVAKVTRDRLMAEYDLLYPQYGFARHKGYGAAFHLQALENYGPSPIHRLSFEPLAKNR